MKKAPCLSVLVFATSACAQIVSIGIKAGVPANAGFQDSLSGTYVRRYIIGPTAEVHLPFHLAFEVDALYRRSGYDTSGTIRVRSFAPGGPVQFFERAHANDWQIPFLAKWEPGNWPIRPFVDAGVTYRHLSGQSTINNLGLADFLLGNALQSGPATTNPNTAGGTIGAGLTLKVLVLRISPEIRYTRWASQSPFGSYLPATTNSNQLDLLVGFTF